jgi:hypothetical protein
MAKAAALRDAQVWLRGLSLKETQGLLDAKKSELFGTTRMASTDALNSRDLLAIDPQENFNFSTWRPAALEQVLKGREQGLDEGAGQTVVEASGLRVEATPEQPDTQGSHRRNKHDASAQYASECGAVAALRNEPQARKHHADGLIRGTEEKKRIQEVRCHKHQPGVHKADLVEDLYPGKDIFRYYKSYRAQKNSQQINHPRESAGKEYEPVFASWLLVRGDNSLSRNFWDSQMGTSPGDHIVDEVANVAGHV